MTEETDWDYKQDMFIKPCACRNECGNHILFMKGRMTHFKGIKDQQFISTATLSVIDMIDLFRNLQESIDIDIERERLEERFKKAN